MFYLFGESLIFVTIYMHHVYFSDHPFTQFSVLRSFQETQDEFVAKQGQTINDRQKDVTLPPWHPDSCGVSDAAILDSLKQKILALSLQQNTFLLSPPDMDRAPETNDQSDSTAIDFDVASVMLKLDPNLASMRYKLVPSR